MNKTNKSEIISLFKSHHGQTFFMTQASGLSQKREKFNLYLPNVIHVPPPQCNRCFYGQIPDTCNLMCVSRIDDFIDFASNRNIAAIIIEPIMGNGDNIVPPEGYLSSLRSFCIERNITLIFDEVQTGIGRTGEMFASQHFNVEPDILTTAKGLGAGFPMAAILCNEEYRGLETKHVSFTFGGNVMAAAAAFKTLSIIEKPEFLANVKNKGAYILSRLHEMKQHYSFIGDCRGVGLMIGFELVDEEGNENIELTHKIIDLGFDNRLLLRSSRYGSGNVIKIRPSLNITSKESAIICDRLEKIFELIHKEKQY